MMMITTTVTIIMALKGAVQDLFSTISHCAANCLQHARSCGQGAVVCNTSGAYHVLQYVRYVMQRNVPVDPLVGLVVKASASRAEDPGFESRLRRNFSGVEPYQ